MKKITYLAVLIFGLSFQKIQAQKGFETAPYECWVDSLIKPESISKFQFFNSAELVLVKNGNRAEVLPTKKGKAKIIDKRIIIKPFTKGQVEKVEIKKDTTFKDYPRLNSRGVQMYNNTDGTPLMDRHTYINSVKVFYVRFDSKVEIPAIPFTFGIRPESNSLTFIPLNQKGEFKDKNDIYQVEGNSTLQLDAKVLQQFKIAKGKKVTN